MPCAACAISLKYRFGFDDSLDVVGVHAVGGVTGALLIGLFATGTLGSPAKGLFYGGGLDQLWKQAIGVVSVGAYSFVMAYLLGKLIEKTMGFRVPEEVEIAGIDLAEHAESAYDFSALGSALSKALAPTAPKAVDESGTVAKAVAADEGTKVEA